MKKFLIASVAVTAFVSSQARAQFFYISDNLVFAKFDAFQVYADGNIGLNADYNPDLGATFAGAANLTVDELTVSDSYDLELGLAYVTDLFTVYLEMPIASSASIREDAFSAGLLLGVGSGLISLDYTNRGFLEYGVEDLRGFSTAGHFSNGTLNAYDGIVGIGFQFDDLTIGIQTGIEGDPANHAGDSQADVSGYVAVSGAYVMETGQGRLTLMSEISSVTRTSYDTSFATFKDFEGERIAVGFEYEQGAATVGAGISYGGTIFNNHVGQQTDETVGLQILFSQQLSDTAILELDANFGYTPNKESFWQPDQTSDFYNYGLTISYAVELIENLELSIGGTYSYVSSGDHANSFPWWPAAGDTSEALQLNMAITYSF